jgi:hypothetical protein
MKEVTILGLLFGREARIAYVLLACIGALLLWGVTPHFLHAAYIPGAWIDVSWFMTEEGN